MPTTWTIAIDWDRDGNFSGEHDDVTRRLVKAEWFVGLQRPFKEAADGSTLLLTLKNEDRRFSPEYSSGSLHGNLAPLRPVKIESNDGSSTRIHWSGWISAIIPTAGKSGAREAAILAHGAMHFLKAAETQIELQENQRSDQIIDALVQEVIFPHSLSHSWVIGDSVYSRAGASTILSELRASADYEEGKLWLKMAGHNWVRQGAYADEPSDTFDVYRGIRDVAAAERGKFFFDREGKAVFWNRHHILDNDQVDASFQDDMSDMQYAFASPEQTKNEIIVTCHPRSVDQRPSTLWELKNAVIRVAPGDTREVYVKYKDEKDKRIGGKEVEVADVEFAKGSCLATVEAKANGANLVFKNESDSQEAIVERCRVIGRKIVDEGQMDARAIDQSSITYFGRRTLNINLPSIDDLDQAQFIADFERDRRETPFGMAQSISLQSHAQNGGARHADQLDLNVGSLIRLRETQTAHDANYFIIGESHELAGGGQHWRTTWYLEPQIAPLPWKLGDALRGKLDTGARLAY